MTPQDDRLLVMPAWDGRGLGVKLVTVFPHNRARGLASVAALYVLMDGETGHPVALIDGESATLKTFRQESDGTVRLEPANPAHETQRYAADRVRIQGVAIGVLRKYR